MRAFELIKNEINGYVIQLKKILFLKKNIKSTPAYQISKVDNINCSFKIHTLITGTGKITTYLPKELVNDKLMLSQFSIEDIQTILGCHYEEIKKPKLSIVKQRFSVNSSEIIFGLRDRTNNKIQDYTASDITKNKILLNHLSPEDAHKIGFYHGIASKED